MGNCIEPHGPHTVGGGHGVGMVGRRRRFGGLIQRPLHGPVVCGPVVSAHPHMHEHMHARPLRMHHGPVVCGPVVSAHPHMHGHMHAPLRMHRHHGPAGLHAGAHMRAAGMRARRRC